MASTVRGAETQTALTARLPLPLPGTRDDMKGRCAATLRRATETSNIHEKTGRFLFQFVDLTLGEIVFTFSAKWSKLETI